MAKARAVKKVVAPKKVAAKKAAPKKAAPKKAAPKKVASFAAKAAKTTVKGLAKRGASAKSVKMLSKIGTFAAAAKTAVAGKRRGAKK